MRSKVRGAALILAPYTRLKDVATRWYDTQVEIDATGALVGTPLPANVVLRLSDAADEWEAALRSVEPATPSVERRRPARRPTAKSQRKTR